MCRAHWRRVPPGVQADVFREYRREPLSLAHVAAMDEAVYEVDARLDWSLEILGLTLMQPWAWAMMDVAGEPGDWKDIENRGWPAKVPAGGMWLALHAGATWHQEGLEALLSGGLRPPPRESVTRSAVLGAVHVTDWVKLGAIGPGHRLERLLGSPWAFGPWCAVIDRRVHLAAPVPCKGALGRWHLPAHVHAAVLRAVRGAP